LPVRKWTQDYREFLEENLPRGEKKKDGVKLFEDFSEFHTEKTIHFEVVLGPQGLERTKQSQLESMLRLKSSVPISNMVLFDAEGRIKKYDDPLDIIKDFATVRLSMYEKRKAHQVGKLMRESEILSAKAKFIKLVITGQLIIKKRKINDLIQDIRHRGFKPVSEMKGLASDKEEAKDDEDEEGDDADAEEGDGDEEAGDGGASSSSAARAATAKGIKDFEYLVGMPISTLTAEKIEELMKQHDAKVSELEALKKKKPPQLWLEDLDELERALTEREAARAKEDKLEQEKIAKGRAKVEKGAGGKRGTKRAASAPADARAAAEGAGDKGRGQKRKAP